MDASGSMDRVDNEGVRLYDGARRGLLQMMGQLPDEAIVGLRVYGHTVAPDAPPAEGCADTELVHPVTTLNRTTMGIAIESYQPSGYTPIGLSVQAAAADLPDVEGATIVLVSDGEDTCHVNGVGPDPCQVAADLVAAGTRVTINTIGFLLPEGAAQRQLACIAEETGGTFVAVNDAAALLEALRTASDAQVTFRPGGERVYGSQSPLDAPILPGAGVYIDEISPQQISHYGIRLERGQQVAARVIVAPRDGIPSREQVGHSNVPSVQASLLEAESFFDHKVDELGQVDPQVPVVGGFVSELDWDPAAFLSADAGTYVLAVDYRSAGGGYDGTVWDLELTIEIVGEAQDDPDITIAAADDGQVLTGDDRTDDGVERPDIGVVMAEPTGDPSVTPTDTAVGEEPSSAPFSDDAEQAQSSDGGGQNPVALIAVVGLVGAGGWKALSKFRSGSLGAGNEPERARPKHGPAPAPADLGDQDPDGPFDPTRAGL
ncbi:von Willebrand factor type A domain protein (plasmid) [Euzebya pacifica]|uniref:von Willebrand factor type A domain protein n=2 Tax=Euzebya pacifica TaxID=1608957 RepID=A0A346Y6Q9_9ACTN|nr:von Willebrand factor type A domain protein [Euzebya pacifica]